MARNLRVLETSLKKAAVQLAHLPAAFDLLRNATGRWSTAWIALLVAKGLMPLAVVYLTRALVDSIVAAIDAGASWQTTRQALLLIIVIAGLMVASEILSGVTKWVRAAQSELLQDHISSLIHEKSASVDLEFYDSAEFYDHLHRARREATYRPTALLDNTGGLFQSGVTLVVMLIALIPFGLWVPAVLLVSTLPAFYVVLRYSLCQHHWRLGATSRERHAWYYDWLLTSSETAAELRLFTLQDHFCDGFNTVRQGLRNEKLELEKGQALAQLGAGAIGLLITGAAMVWMVWQAMQAQISLGSLAFFYQAFNQGQRMMRQLLDSTGQIYYNMLFLGNLFEFLNLRPKIKSAIDSKPLPMPLVRGIFFERVTFRYPTSNQLALEELDLRFGAGQITAIVGRNGAGKSTLFKLLCRFYDPDEGRVTIDGVDLRNLSLDELRRAITVLFQEPVHYQTSASENILLGDTTIDGAAQKINAAAKAAGAAELIGRLPEGYETILGRWFGGIELSVGEWQRLALARAFVRESPIIILDEPTSAMDSWTEIDWMQRFRQLARGRTAIIITHRFTTAMQADVIHVMDSGRLVESGSHTELLAGGGLYSASWHAQMRDGKPVHVCRGYRAKLVTK